jgi:hypothetical protein
LNHRAGAIGADLKRRRSVDARACNRAQLGHAASKAFQRIPNVSKLFPRKSKLFPNFSKEIPRKFFGRFVGFQGLMVANPGFRLLPLPPRRAAGQPQGRSATFFSLPRILFFGRKMSWQNAGCRGWRVEGAPLFSVRIPRIPSFIDLYML